MPMSARTDQGGVRMRRIAGTFVVAVVLATTAAAIAEANPYTPNGTIIAESGFRPDTNGYSFPNYGNENDPQNLDAASMVKLFGSGVCADAVQDGSCTLTPAAQTWRETQ